MLVGSRDYDDAHIEETQGLDAFRYRHISSASAISSNSWVYTLRSSRTSTWVSTYWQPSHSILQPILQAKPSRQQEKVDRVTSQLHSPICAGVYRN